MSASECSRNKCNFLRRPCLDNFSQNIINKTQRLITLMSPSSPASHPPERPQTRPHLSTNGRLMLSLARFSLVLEVGSVRSETLINQCQASAGRGLESYCAITLLLTCRFFLYSVIVRNLLSGTNKI